MWFSPDSIWTLAKATGRDRASTVKNLGKGGTLNGHKYATIGQFTATIKVLDVVVRGCSVQLVVALVGSWSSARMSSSERPGSANKDLAEGDKGVGRW